ncbi:MAG: aminodeoxychorismate/anthranilate synthase component II [FCB group bacterium]|nr:aminodeoxychorismate/anthranilate synthase component II [FCB group bacterium]
MVLLIDNYDSFTYNLAQYMGEMGNDPKVIRNDEVSLDDIRALEPSHIIISPGPGRPEDAGLCCDLIGQMADKIPILGICLGHQCIAAAFDSSVGRAARVMHGKTSAVFHTGQGVFQGLPSPFNAARYHSLIVEEEALSDQIEVTAYTDTGEIMGIRLRDHPVEGLQFHPESILTKHGKQLLANFLNMR